MKSNEAYVLVAIALINSLPHCLFETPIGLPPMAEISSLFQVLSLVILLVASKRIVPLLQAPWFIVAIPLLLCASVIVIKLPIVSPYLSGICAGIIGACEVVLWLYQGAMLARLSEKTISLIALGGMEASFFLAAVLLSLPEGFSLAFQALQVLLLIPLFLKQAPGFSGVCEPSSLGTRKFLLPFRLVLIACTFPIGMNFLRTGVGLSGNWGSTFALAAVLSGIILYVEVWVMRGSLVSVLEISAALLLAGPILYLGAGLGHNSLLLSLATIGFFLIMPRLLQWIIVYAREEGINPLRSLCVFYLINAVAHVIGSQLYEIVEFSGNMQVQFGVALLLTAVIVFCCFIPYSERTRDRIILQFEEEEVQDEVPCNEEETDMAKTLQSICARIAKEHFLTKREREVLELLARRKKLASISDELVLSRNTVKSHVLHIHQKLDVHSHEELFSLIEHYDARKDL